MDYLFSKKKKFILEKKKGKKFIYLLVYTDVGVGTGG